MDAGAVAAGIWQVVIGIVIGVGVTILSRRFLEKKPDLRYTITSTGDLPPDSRSRRLGPNSRAEDDFVVVTCKFTNRGNQHVQDVPFKWGLKKKAKLRSLNADQPDRVISAAADQGDDGKIVLLNPGESVVLFWVFETVEDPGLLIEARAPGVVARPELSSWDNQVLDVARIALLIGFVAVMAALTVYRSDAASGAFTALALLLLVFYV